MLNRLFITMDGMTEDAMAECACTTGSAWALLWQDACAADANTKPAMMPNSIRLILNRFIRLGWRLGLSTLDLIKGQLPE